MPSEHGKDSCLYKDQRYAHGSLMCETDRCMECNDGNWQRKTDWSSFPSCIEEDEHEHLPGGPDVQWMNLK